MKNRIFKAPHGYKTCLTISFLKEQRGDFVTSRSVSWEKERPRKLVSV